MIKGIEGDSRWHDLQIPNEFTATRQRMIFDIETRPKGQRARLAETTSPVTLLQPRTYNLLEVCPGKAPFVFSSEHPCTVPSRICSSGRCTSATTRAYGSTIAHPSIPALY